MRNCDGGRACLPEGSACLPKGSACLPIGCACLPKGSLPAERQGVRTSSPAQGVMHRIGCGCSEQNDKTGFGKAFRNHKYRNKPCRCSSVVEHFLGKEEVVSSILINGSTGMVSCNDKIKKGLRNSDA